MPAASLRAASVAARASGKRNWLRQAKQEAVRVARVWALRSFNDTILQWLNG